VRRGVPEGTRHETNLERSGHRGPAACLHDGRNCRRKIAFSSNDFTTQVELPGAGTVPLNVARICTWTWVCLPPPLGPNNHPNAVGYGAIGGAFAKAFRL
jgi:hypothetical protein